MGPKKKRLSIICPAYQEQEVLPLFHEELCATLAVLEKDYHIEVVYVDDGSRDGTLAFLRKLTIQDGRVRYLSFTRNFGKEAAILAGLEHCQGDLIVTMDSDSQHPPSVIAHMLDKMNEGYHVVMARREEYRPPGLVKRVFTKLFYRFLAALSDTGIDPAGSDFLLLDRAAVTTVLQVREKHRFLKGLIYWLGYPMGEVRFKPAERAAGTTKFHFGRLAALGLDSLFSFSRAPLRGAAYLGVSAVALGLILGVWFVVQAILYPGQVSGGWAYLTVSTHVLAGSILFALGLVGEYIGRIFEQVKQRPLYVLKEDSREIALLAARTTTVPSSKAS